jgi:hypothetical protein
MSRRAISIVSGAIFSFGASGFAFAADMAVKAPPKPTAPAPVYSWTGCYVGVSGGYVWNRARSTYIDDPNAFFGDPILGLGVGASPVL